MKIPQEIQDLMPERVRNGTKPDWYFETLTEDLADGFNFALAEVEAVLPQMLALAEKRGAEGEREMVGKEVWTLFKKWEFQADSQLMMELENLAESITQPNL